VAAPGERPVRVPATPIGPDRLPTHFDA
jgi:hypothetical protein